MEIFLIYAALGILSGLAGYVTGRLVRFRSSKAEAKKVANIILKAGKTVAARRSLNL